MIARSAGVDTGRGRGFPEQGYRPAGAITGSRKGHPERETRLAGPGHRAAKTPPSEKYEHYKLS